MEEVKAPLHKRAPAISEKDIWRAMSSGVDRSYEGALTSSWET